MEKYGNKAYAENFTDKLCHELFTYQAKLNPTSVAVCFENSSVTYAELDKITNQLANYLKKRGVGVNTIIGIYMKRSVDMIIAILGIIKAGGAYLPIDPRNPEARTLTIIEDSGINLVLTQKQLEVPNSNNESVVIDSNWQSAISNFSDAAPVNNVSVGDLIYVLYTSGSTGKPKAVLYPHGGILTLFDWMQSEFKITNKDVFLQKTSYTFDISTYELLLPLQSGARIVILPEEKEIDIFLLHDIIDKEKVSIINFTPSMLKIFSSMNLNEKLDSLRLVLISGEALKQKIVNEAIEYLPDCELYNVYGLTEIQSVTAYKCNGSDTANIVSLGRPIPDTTLYVLDESQKRVPVGHPGELYVSGATLANGYLNNPDLTEQKFLTNPFSDDKISLIYRTGDRVRCLEDGSLEYIGRLDDQVKIRGYRVELGEIENLLSKHDLVKDIAILCADKFSEERSLAAYVVPNLERALQLHVEAHRITEILREYTASKLPHYMVPTFFTLIEALPLNKNGKIDRSHLINLLSK